MRKYCCCFGTETPGESIEEVHRKGIAAWEHYRTSSPETSKGKPQLLTEAIDFYNQALTRTQATNPFRPTILISLVLALLEDKNPSPADLALIELHFAEVVREYNASANGTLKRNEGYSITVALGGHYERLYKLSSNLNEFNRCLSNYTEAARSYAPRPEDQIQWFSKVAELHTTCAEESDLHLEKALNALHAARGLCQDDAYLQRLQISDGTCTVHKKRYARRKEKADLVAAITECDYALTLHPPEQDRIRLLNDYLFSVCVFMDDHEIGSGSSLRLKAIVRGRELLALFSGHLDSEEPKRKATLMLANILSWMKANPSNTELDEAIAFYSEVQRHKPRDPDLLGKKAAAIWLRWRKTGNREGLQEAIDLSIIALEAASMSKKSNIASNIGAIYLEKAKKQNIGDLEQAREYYRKAAELSSAKTDKDLFEGSAKHISNTIGWLQESAGFEFAESRWTEEEEGRGRTRTRRLSGERRRSLSRKASIG